MSYAGKALRETPLIWGVLYPSTGPPELLLYNEEEPATVKWGRHCIPDHIHGVLLAEAWLKPHSEKFISCDGFAEIEGYSGSRAMTLLGSDLPFWTMTSLYLSNPFFKAFRGPVVMAVMTRTEHSYSVMTPFKLNRMVTEESLRDVMQYRC